MNKLKLPKIRLSLNVFLWLCFIVVVLVEATVLYFSLYVNFRKTVSEATANQIPVSEIKFDLPSFIKVSQWLEAKISYEPDSYQLASPALGREEPFAEY